MNDDSNDSLPVIKREVKTYVLRAGRMTAAQEKAYKELVTESSN